MFESLGIKKGFLQGIASNFDLFGAEPFEHKSIFQTSEIESLGKDWKSVGDDLRVVFKVIKKSNLDHTQNETEKS